MEIIQEVETVGNGIIPIRLFRTEMNNCTGSFKEICSGESNGTLAEIQMEKCENWLPSWHSYYEILYFLNGHARLQINSNYYDLTTGDIALINSYDIHNLIGQCVYWVLLIDPFKIMQIKGIPSDIFPNSAERKILYKNNLDNTHLRDIIIDCIENVDKYYQGREKEFSLKIMSKLYYMLSIIHNIDLEQSSRTQILPINMDTLERLNCIFEYISTNYNEQITLANIAKIINFSPNYFCRFFKNNIGKSFFEYLNSYRCSKAEILINTTKKPLTEISFEVGFESLSYFDKVYKKYKGYKPSNERKKLREVTN